MNFGFSLSKTCCLGNSDEVAADIASGSNSMDQPFIVMVGHESFLWSEIVAIKSISFLQAAQSMGFSQQMTNCHGIYMSCIGSRNLLSRTGLLKLS